MSVKNAIVCALFLVVSVSIRAQETRGSIQGTVSDSSGALVPGATVTATNTATNVNIAATTNREGRYDLLFLLSGVYHITAGAPAFKTARRENVELRIHERLQVDFILELGAVSEQVQVTAEAPLLQTATANTGQVFDSKRLADLPIPHGSPFTLIFFAPGSLLARSSNRLYQETSNLDQFANEMTFNGQPAGTSDWTIDGSPNIQSSKSIGPMNSPPADIVQEVKLETAYDASVGHSSGTVVNVSLKSGGNQPHGAAYFFYRNPDFDANSFFGNRTRQEKPPYKNNRWGASLTGPVTIPKIYKGRDRTFFTYGYEGVHRTENNTITSTVPTPKQLTGDFSDLLAIAPEYQIYDPATIKPAAGGRFSIAQFPGNIIPPSRINPISKNIAAHWTKANTTGERDGTNNFTQQNRAEPDLYFNHTVRIDHNLSDGQRVYGRFTAMRRIAGPYFNWYDDPSQGNLFTGRTKQAAFDDVYTLSPRTVLNARYSYSRFTGVSSAAQTNFNPASLGFSPDLVKLMTRQGSIYPCFEVSGLINQGCQGNGFFATDIHAVFVNINRQYAAHAVRFGVDFRANRGIDRSLGSAAGDFVFDTSYTRGPFDNSPSSPNNLGQGLAALLLGQPTGGLIDNNDSQANQSTYWALYFHDNWRASRKLTLDLGVRWEYEGPMTERYNRSVRGFDPNAVQKIEAAARTNYAGQPDALSVDQFRVRGGLLFAGAGGLPRGLWDRSWKNFAPRFGFAYQGLRNLVLRGGFGIYPISIGQSTRNYSLQYGFNQATNVIPTLDRGQTFLATLANPFPNGILSAPGASLGAQTFLGQSIAFYNPIPRTPYSMNWNFNTQSVLPGQFLLEIGYVGNKTLKLRAGHNINALPNRYLSTSFFRDQNTINYLTANVPNPFQGLLPGTGLNGSTISRSQLLLPYPQFATVTMQDYQGYTWFHSLQMRTERRFSRGLTLQASYTFSKKMEALAYLNPGDSVPYETISSIDRPHTITFTGLYELPFGRGKTLAGRIGRVPDLFAGGWELGATWQFQSGLPIGFGDVIFTGDVKNIPLARDQRTVDRWFNVDAGFEQSSRNARGSNLRQFPLRLSGVRADVFNSWDLSLLKSFALHEAHRVQFRAEFYNVLNHTTALNPPNTTPTSSAFGRITGQSSLPRNIQLGLKYVF